MVQYLLKGVELHRARFIKAYGALKFIHSVKHSIMQFFFFYDGVLHKTTFINGYGVLKLSMINKLRVGFFCKCMDCSMAQYLQKGVELTEHFPFKKLHSIEIFCCIDMEYFKRQTMFKIQRILFLKSSRLHFFGITMEYSMRQYFIKAMEYCQFILFIVLFLKSLKNSITQNLLKGMEPLK